MTTKKLALFYQLTQKEVIPPSTKELERKDKFIKQVQKSVEVEYKPKMMKVTYEVFNPELNEMRKFFHTCVKYYAIQNMGLTDRDLSTEEYKQYREELLDELLGFDFHTVNKVIRKRTSTSTYKEAEEWHTLLKELQETVFDSSGYTFPDSKTFWRQVSVLGYSKAQGIAIKSLQNKLKKK